MQKYSASLEIFRWGYAHVPGIIFCYAQELELDIEDIGILSAIFYTYEFKSKPLFQTGIKAGQVLQCCPTLTKNKLSRKLSKFKKLNILEIVDASSRIFADKEIYLEPLMEKLESVVIRDHPLFSEQDSNSDYVDFDAELGKYRQKVEQLELQLAEEKNKRVIVNDLSTTNGNYKKLADFIASKTGNLLSVKMANELKKWLDEMGFKPEFLFCLLEMCFERKIYNPSILTKIASEIKEYSINTVEGLELYFTKYFNGEKNIAFSISQFDPDIIEFGKFTGIDMNAEARKMIYYKWRYDWAFSHNMIMKAGQIMCQRTKNGGLEYVDSVLNNWLLKHINTVEEAEKEIANFKAKKKKEKATSNVVKTGGKKNSTTPEYEIYVPPKSLEKITKSV